MSKYWDKEMGKVWDFQTSCKKMVEECKITLDSNGIWTCNLLDVMKFDPKLYECLVDKDTDETIRVIKLFAKDEIEQQQGVTLNSINWLPNKSMPFTFFSKVNHSMVGKLIRCRGFVLSANSIIMIEEIFLHCPNCNNRFRVHNARSRKCVVCGKPVEGSDYHTERNSYRDMEFQEQYDGLSISEVMRVRINLPDNPDAQIIDYPDLFGNEHDLMAVVRSEVIKKDGVTLYKELYLDMVGIKPIRTREFKPAYIKELVEFGKSLGADALKKLANHIAINVYGNEEVKQALLVTTIGCAKESTLPNNKCTQMCAIMISDTAMGKSFMSKSFLPYVAKSSYITANTSGAGLLGGVEKKRSGEYSFTQGDLIMANQSFVILDEVDNMQPEHREVLLTVISEGVVQVKKIKKFEMNVHTNFIIQGNPRTSHFDPHVGYFSQIDLTRPFLDRADFLIILQRPYDMSNDAEYDAFNKFLMKDHKEKRELDDVKVKDYLHYVKHFVPNPTFSKEAEDRLIDRIKFLNQKIMSLYHQEEARPLTPRTMVSLQKICMAIGRILLRKEVTVDIVDRAFNLYMEASVKTMTSSFGTFDTYEIADITTKKSNRPQGAKALGEWVVAHLERHSDGVEFGELLEKVVNGFGLTEELFNTVITKLKNEGAIMENPSGNFKAI